MRHVLLASVAVVALSAVSALLWTTAAQSQNPTVAYIGIGVAGAARNSDAWFIDVARNRVIFCGSGSSPSCQVVPMPQ